MDLDSRFLLRGELVGLRFPEAGDRQEYFDLRRASEVFHRPWEPDPAPGSDPLRAR